MKLCDLVQIKAGARQHGLKYSQFIAGCDRAGVALNRKVLADLAATEPYSFKAVVELAKVSLPSKEVLQ